MLCVALTAVAGSACSSTSDTGDTGDTGNEAQRTDSAIDIVNDALDELEPETVSPEVDPSAYQPTWLPEGFSILRASAASPDFMSIEVGATDPDDAATASVIWGDELVDFEVLAQSDPAGKSQTIRGSVGTLFTFASTEDSVGPALIWREPSGLPVLVVGSPETTSDEVVAIANGVEEITQQEFLDLAIALAEERLAASVLDGAD